MKRVIWAILLAATGLLLASCTTPPVTIGLTDVEIDLQVAADSAGKIIFPKEPLKLKNPIPGTQVASVSVQGRAKLDSPATLSFDVYAASQDPGELGCTRVDLVLSAYYVCDPGTAGVEKVSQSTIEFNNDDGPVSFRLSGGVLADGINNGTLYLGAQISGGTAGNKLTLYDLTATVQLSVGR